MIVVFNHQMYSSNSYSGNPSYISRAAKTIFIPFDQSQPRKTNLDMQEQQIESDENFLNPGWL